MTAALALSSSVFASQPRIITSPARGQTLDPTVNAWGRSSADIPADPSVRFGRLPNGMKYAIRANSTPQGAASIRMHFTFGSIAESDRERGLAHFIEHMAFNGTTNVAEGEMKRILERHGLAFGADTNAFTSYDSTLYVLELPKVGEELVDTALFLMREVASEVKFDPAAVDRERGVILSEKRSREGYQLRRAFENIRYHMPDSAFAVGLPIGTEQVLKTAKASELADLYRRYYRPENMTLVIAGDVDPAAIEAKLRARFGNWSGKGPGGPRLDRGRVDLKRPAEFSSFTDPAVETTVMLTRYRPWEDPADSKARRRELVVQQAALGLLTRRLQNIANSADARLINGAASQSPARDLAWATSISAVAPEGEWQGALAQIEQEIRRATEHGFTAGELRTQLSDMHGSLKMAADQESTRRSSALADAVVGIIEGNDIITKPRFRLEFFQQIRPTITVAEVNATIRKLWSGSEPLVYVTDKKPVAKAEMAQVFAASGKVAVLPHKDPGLQKFAYGDYGAPGKVVADARIADLGIRTLRFANNVRLNIKKTDFEKGAVRYSVRIAGGDLALPRDKMGLSALISTLSPIGGLEKHSAEDLKQIFAGRGVQPGYAVDADAIVAAGRTIPNDLALQMKLTAAFVTAPGYRPEAATRWRNLVPIFDKQWRATPQGVLGAKVPGVLANDDPRFSFPEAAVLSARTLDEARTILTPLLARAPIEIGIVGDVDEAAAIDAVAKSFGALPMRDPAAPDYRQERQAGFRQSLAPVRLTHGGPADQAVLVAAWGTTDDDDQRETVGLVLLADVLRLELTDKLREELGDTYTVAVSSASSDIYDGYGYLRLSTVVAPDKLAAVEKAAQEVVARLRDKPIDADLLARARNPNMERIDRQQRENPYWLDLVDEAQQNPDRLQRHRLRKGIYQAITAGDVQALARKYLAPEKMLAVHIVSDSVTTASKSAASAHLP
ncbi:MAG TPA: insulinase family protein [Sphingomicrobium sp.]|nr:insulinase family protein [Sphingomicrobium sp.]